MFSISNHRFDMGNILKVSRPSFTRCVSPGVWGLPHGYCLIGRGTRTIKPTIRRAFPHLLGWRLPLNLPPLLPGPSLLWSSSFF